MDREELERLGMSVPGLATKIKAYQNEPTAQRRKDIVSVILDAVLPAYDAMRDAEWEQVGWRSEDGWFAWCGVEDEPPPSDFVPVFVRRVGEEGGS